MNILIKSKEEGITLVALVVTIIVLLILAGVSISVAIGNRGLFDRAKDAKIAMEDAEILERIKLAELSAVSNGNGELYYDNLVDALNDEFGEGEYEISPQDPDAEEWTITKNRVHYTTGKGSKRKEGQVVNYIYYGATADKYKIIPVANAPLIDVSTSTGDTIEKMSTESGFEWNVGNNKSGILSIRAKYEQVGEYTYKVYQLKDEWDEWSDRVEGTYYEYGNIKVSVNNSEGNLIINNVDISDRDEVQLIGPTPGIPYYRGFNAFYWENEEWKNGTVEVPYEQTFNNNKDSSATNRFTYTIRNNDGDDNYKVDGENDEYIFELTGNDNGVLRIPIKFKDRAVVQLECKISELGRDYSCNNETYKLLTSIEDNNTTKYCSIFNSKEQARSSLEFDIEYISPNASPTPNPNPRPTP